MSENEDIAVPMAAGLFLAEPSSVYPTIEAGQERAVAYASFWRRMGALALDLVIVYAASWPLSLVLLRLPWKPVVALWFVASCYFWIGNAFGATLGKKILSIRVVDEAGKRPGLVRSLKRCILPSGLGIVYALSYPNVTVLVLL